ncbi:MAG TPA: hypothetical protein VGR47_09950 [Terracidiphilus sp.]|nr:hypothetical protein [Terracidiphilus sp.]
MNRTLSILFLLFVGVACSDTARAQQSFWQRFLNHNNAASAIEPGWPTPVVEADPRLTQYYRFSFSSEYTPARTHTVDFGNARGGGIIAWNRAEFDVLPPPYIQHHSTAADGFGDTSVLVKVRLASGNAEHGNYIATAILSHTFATGSASNGALTDSWNPTLAGGKGLTKRIDIESSLGGAMPTGKIATQGRSIVWNSLVQDHVTHSVWMELEENATYFRGGSHDGKMQNFITPGAFYIYRNKQWAPTHPFFVFDAGMQIATSAFHTYNHNLILETRILF